MLTQTNTKFRLPGSRWCEAQRPLAKRWWLTADKIKRDRPTGIKILFVASACCFTNAARALHREHGQPGWLRRRETQHTGGIRTENSYDHAVAAALDGTGRRACRQTVERLRARETGRNRLRRPQINKSAHGRRGDPAREGRRRRPARPAPVRQVGVGRQRSESRSKAAHPGVAGRLRRLRLARLPVCS